MEKNKYNTRGMKETCLNCGKTVCILAGIGNVARINENNGCWITKMKRKHPLLKTEIEMLQLILEDKTFPTKEYRLKLVERLEELKKKWYKIKLTKKRKKKQR